MNRRAVMEKEECICGRGDDAEQNVNEQETPQEPSSTQSCYSHADGGLNDILVADDPVRAGASGWVDLESFNRNGRESAVDDGVSDADSDLTVSLVGEIGSYELTRWVTMPDAILVPPRYVRRYSNPF
ncbi:hypothetical protein FOMPIDRAFT_82865 [Fomitopsis schrenkii]|uniref:Uncharacterized protein n=1 Tax=Fomitopsis schrenkii TaxID=2126942 RepID=S8DV66_FOMSC|nr:hypothetical protein FOMPIDRAFT_82865 [Fomitopsis schrenkii]